MIYFLMFLLYLFEVNLHSFGLYLLFIMLYVSLSLFLGSLLLFTLRSRGSCLLRNVVILMIIVCLFFLMLMDPGILGLLAVCQLGSLVSLICHIRSQLFSYPVFCNFIVDFSILLKSSILNRHINFSQHSLAFSNFRQS